METKVLTMLLPMALEGFFITFGVFFITLVISIPLSLLVAKFRMSKNKIISNITAFYIYVMRGTPLLLQLMFIFFGFHYIPVIGFSFGRYQAIFVAFILNYTAYFAEIFRGGINSVDPLQYEASTVLGLSKTCTFFKIILPQVIKNVIPSLSNEVITLIKDTSLVYIVGIGDILKAAKSVSNVYAAFSPYIYVGIIYLIITAIFTRLLAMIENKFNYYR